MVVILIKILTSGNLTISQSSALCQLKTRNILIQGVVVGTGLYEDVGTTIWSRLAI